MDPGHREYATVDVRMPADLFTDLDAYAVAHDYNSVDDAVADALARRDSR
jgi:hypothetical protein